MNILTMIWAQIIFTFERTDPRYSSKNIPCDVNGPPITAEEYRKRCSEIKKEKEKKDESPPSL